MSDLLTNVDPDEIKRLNAGDLVHLLHRLLLCEARAMQLNSHGILVPFDITVPDGGSDGEWKPKDAANSFVSCEYIPRPWTRYQCKAERITESICRHEVAPPDSKGNFHVKARVQEVLEAGGCYAFFSNGHEVKPSADDDIDTIVRDQLRKAGFAPAATAVIEFYGCNRIADWVNKFPSAVRFVREVTKGFGGIHYFTYDGWSKHADVTGQFFTNSALNEIISTLRNTLLDGRNHIIRLTGLSGVGKSRLVHEALRPSSDGDARQDSLSASCIYISYQDAKSDLPGLINHLADNAYSAIAIVDDCPPDIHDRIVNVVSNSNITIISIFHEPQPERQDSHLLNLLPEQMENVVFEILKADPDLQMRGNAAIKTIATFAQGFPQIAKLIVEFHRTPTIDELRDRGKLLQKLLSQGNDPDPGILLAVQSLSLFHVIGGTANALEAQLVLIRELFCPEISENEYRRLIGTQKNRRIIQEVADTLMVTPRPLAVALAADFISFFPHTKWPLVVEKLENAGLLDSFCRRIEELEFSDRPEEIGKMFLEIGLPFNDTEYLLVGSAGAGIFRALTLLNPSVAIKVAKRALHNQTLQALHDSIDARRDLVEALYKLAWEASSFSDAAELLLKLAAAENEGWGNNATGIFKQLFQLALSGTKTPASKRLIVLRNAFESKESQIRKVAIEALGTALQYSYFSRSGGATLTGKREANLDWSPQTYEEALPYWRECVHLLSACILTDSDEAENAKRTLGENIGAILNTPSLLQELEPEFKALCEKFGNLWPTVKDSVKKFLHREDTLAPEQKVALIRWKEYLTPSGSNIRSRIHDIVTTPGWHFEKTDDGEYRALSQEEAECFGLEIVERGIELVPFLPQLLLGEQQQGFAFGATVGSKLPYAQNLIQAIFELWPRLDPQQRNAAFACGVLNGQQANRQFCSEVLDRISANPELIVLLIPMTNALGAITEKDFIRIRDALIATRLQPESLSVLLWGRPLQSLESSFIIEEFSFILNARPETGQFLFKMLFSLCYSDSKKFEQFAGLFQKLLLTNNMPLRDNHLGWEWHDTTLKLMDSAIDEKWLQELSAFICNFIISSKTWFGYDHLQSVVAELFKKAPTETWHAFQSAFNSNDNSEKYVLLSFLAKFDNSLDDTGSVLWNLPEHDFQTWIKSDLDFIPRILEKMGLYTVEKDEERETFKWHPYALLLLAEGIDEEKLTHALFRNLYSFGSIGSRVPYLEKRLALVRSLFSISNAKVKRIAKEVEVWAIDELERKRREELNRNAFLD